MRPDIEDHVRQLLAAPEERLSADREAGLVTTVSEQPPIRTVGHRFKSLIDRPRGSVGLP